MSSKPATTWLKKLDFLTLFRVALIAGLLSSCAPETTLKTTTGVLDSGEFKPVGKLAKRDLKPLWQLFEKRQLEVLTEEILSLSEIPNLHPITQSELWLLQGVVMAHNRQIDRATKQLDKVLQSLKTYGYKSSRLTKDFRQQLSNLKSRVYAANHQPGKLAESLIEALQWLPNAEKKTTVEQIWGHLKKIPLSTLQGLAKQAIGSDVKGWYELALSSRNALSASRQHQNYRLWRAEWSNHIAARQPLVEFQTLSSLLEKQPRQIAVMLPLSGQLAGAGKAIQQGMLAAHFYSTHKSSLNFFDTGIEKPDIQKIYNLAVGNGAELIIGPLQKSLLSEMLPVVNKKTAVLLLNYLPEDDPSNYPNTVYQFGLAPDGELNQLVERARLEGGIRSVIIHSKTSWGQNTADRVAQKWQAAGGTVVKQIVVDKPRNAVKRIAVDLDLQKSTDRSKVVARLINRPVSFAPRNREDIDLILLIAEPHIANAVKPALTYHLVNPVPVYATSRSIPTNSNAMTQLDLTGIRYCDLPWRISDNPFKTALEGINPEVSTISYGLFALGVDAIGLATRLHQFKENPNLTINGTTGRLSLKPNRRFHQQLSWATINEKGSVPLLPLSAQSID